jgi:2-polyprenyl-3-methyl-5-hydroxy-6-metoxy-1,4-benzoquinol methylase
MKICPACDARYTGPEWRCASCGWAAARRGPIVSVAPAHGAPGFAAEFFDPLAEAEDRHFWFAARNALLAWALRRYFPGARTMLDAGCGNGQVARALLRAAPGLRITGSEAFPEALAIASTKAPGVELVQADVRALPWEHEFDVVGAFDVLEHVKEDQEAARRLARAARPGGGVIVTVPQHRWLWSPVDDYSRHERRYTRRGLVALLEGAGLSVIRTTSFVSLPLPALALSRAIQRTRPAEPVRELRISTVANAVGKAVMDVERVLIRGGVPLPAGGSLLAIARAR